MRVKPDCSVLACNFNNNKSFMKFLVSSVHLPASSIGYRPPRCDNISIEAETTGRDAYYGCGTNQPRQVQKGPHGVYIGMCMRSMYMYRHIYTHNYTYTQFFEMIKHIIIHSYCNYISRNHILADLITSKHQTSKGCNLGYR